MRIAPDGLLDLWRIILAIHLRKRGRDPESFDLIALASGTDNYSGADIEQVVITGLKLAFHAGKPLKTEHLLQAAPEVRPLSKTDPERVAAMTAWLERHTKAANHRAAEDRALSTGSKRGRKVAL